MSSIKRMKSLIKNFKIQCWKKRCATGVTLNKQYEIYNNFLPVYYFTKTLGVMPLTVRRVSNTVRKVKAAEVTTATFEMRRPLLKWSWWSVVYSLVVIAVYLSSWKIVEKTVKSTADLIDDIHEQGTVSEENSTGVSVTENSGMFDDEEEDGDEFESVPAGETLYYINKYLSTSCSLLITLVSIIKLRDLGMIIEDMREFDRVNLSGRKYLPDKKHLNRVSKRCFYFSVISVVACVAVSVVTSCVNMWNVTSTKRRRTKWLPFMALILQDLVKMGSFSAEMQFGTLCYFLYQRMVLINTILAAVKESSCIKTGTQRNASSKSEPAVRIDRTRSTICKIRSLDSTRQLATCNDISKVRMSYRQHVDLSDRVLAMFEIQLLIAEGHNACLIVANLYYSVYVALGEVVPLSPVLSGVAWASNYFSRMLFISAVANAATKESMKTRHIAHHFIQRHHCKEMKEEVEILTSYLECRKLEFSVFGLLKLDFNFICKVIITVATYVVLLVQFNAKKLD